MRTKDVSPEKKKKLVDSVNKLLLWYLPGGVKNYYIKTLPMGIEMICSKSEGWGNSRLLGLVFKVTLTL